MPPLPDRRLLAHELGHQLSVLGVCACAYQLGIPAIAAYCLGLDRLAALFDHDPLSLTGTALCVFAGIICLHAASYCRQICQLLRARGRE